MGSGGRKIFGYHQGYWWVACLHYTGNLAIDLKSGKIAGENETDPGNLQKCRLRAGSHRNYNVGAKMSPTWRFKIKIAKCKLENQNRKLI